MATIASLAVNLTANTARYAQELQRAEQANAQFNRELNRSEQIMQNVQRVASRMAITLGALKASFFLTMRSATSYADQIKTVALQTGIAYENMQALAIAAQQSNVSFDTLASALRGFARRSAEAARGNEGFLQGFRLLGFTQREVAEGMRNLDEWLVTVADRIAALPTTAQQSAVAMILMSNAGRQMIPLLAQGGDAIRGLMEQARASGMVLREEQVVALNMVSDMTAILQDRIAGLSRMYAAGFAPALLVVLDRVNRFLDLLHSLDDEQRQQLIRLSAYSTALMTTATAGGVLAVVLNRVMRIMQAFGMMANLVFTPFVLRGALVAGIAWAIWEAWSALQSVRLDISLPEVSLPNVDLERFELMWLNAQLIARRGRDAVAETIVDIQWPAITLPAPDPEQVELAWLNTLLILRRSENAIREVIGELQWPQLQGVELPAIDLEAWELRWLNALLQLRRAKTAIQEELATWQLPRITIPDVGMPRLDVSGLQLPELDLPAWRRQWDEAEQTAREGHQAIAREIQGIQWPPLPRIEMLAPDWPALAPPEAVISGLETVGRHLEQLQQKVAQLTPPDWQDWQVPPEVAEFARGTMIGQAAIQTAEIVASLQEGKITWDEAARELLTTEVKASLLGVLGGLFLKPLPLRLASVAIALLPPDALSIEGFQEWVGDIWERTKQQLANLGRRLAPEQAEAARVISAVSREFADLDAAIGDVDLRQFMLTLGMMESGLRDVANATSTARGEFQMLEGTRRRIEEIFGPVNWEDRTERIRAAFRWLQLGVQNEMATIQQAAQRLGIEMEEALHLWWVAGGPALKRMQDLEEVITRVRTKSGQIQEITARELLERRARVQIPDFTMPELEIDVAKVAVSILQWDFPDAVPELAAALGRFLGERSVEISALMASTATSVGYLVGKEIIIPFMSGFVRGFMEGLAELILGKPLGLEEIERAFERAGDDMEQLTRELHAVSVVLGHPATREGFSQFLDQAQELKPEIADIREELERMAEELELSIGLWERLGLLIKRMFTGGHPNVAPIILPMPGVQLGLQHGTILPGVGGPESIPALLAPGEAVVPYRVWSRGPDALVAWFRAMGAPGFQRGAIVGPYVQFEGGSRVDDLTLIQRIIAHLRAAAVDAGPDWAQRIETVVRILEYMARAAEMGGRALEETTQFLRDIDQALREGPQSLLEMADAGDTLARRLLGLGDEWESAERKVVQRWESAIDGFVAGLDTGSSALDRFTRELMRAVFVPGAGWEGLVQFGIGLVGQLIGGLFAERPPEARPREFEPFVSEFAAVDPAEVGVVPTQAAIAEAARQLRQAQQVEAELQKELVKAQKELAKREKQYAEVSGHWWNPSLVQRRKTRLVEAEQTLRNVERALADTTREVERLGRELQQMEEALPRFLGIDIQNIGRAIEAGINSADLAQIGANLEAIVRGAVIRGWLTSEKQLARMELFGDLVMNAVQRFAETGIITETDLAPIRDVIADIETEAAAFNQILERLGLTVERTNERFSDLNRNVPIGFIPDVYRLQAIMPTAVASVGSASTTIDQRRITINVTITDSDDPRETWRRLQRVIEEEAARDGTLVTVNAPNLTD